MVDAGVRIGIRGLFRVARGLGYETYIAADADFDLPVPFTVDQTTKKRRGTLLGFSKRPWI